MGSGNGICNSYGSCNCTNGKGTSLNSENIYCDVECVQSLCNNNGVTTGQLCNDQGYCNCKEGFKGNYCEEEIECGEKNQILVNNICVCKDGYTGNNCEYDCTAYPIGAYCSDSTYNTKEDCENEMKHHSHSCSNIEYNTKEECENEEETWTQQPTRDYCNNNGICKQGQCECDENKYGLFCENVCTANTCNNNGTENVKEHVFVIVIIQMDIGMEMIVQNV